MLLIIYIYIKTTNGNVIIIIKINNMEYNISSGDEYAQLLIDNIGDIQEELKPYLTVLITEKCNETYTDYITGKTDDYRLTEEDLEKLWEEAISLMINEALGRLMDKGLLEATLNEEGNVMYGLSNEGKKVSEELFGPKSIN